MIDTNTEAVIIQTESTTIVFGSNLSSKNHTDKAKEMGISTIDYRELEEVLKNYYNITQPLIVKKVDFNSNLSLTNDTNLSDSISFEFYHPITGEKLDPSLIEDPLPQIAIYIPLKDKDKVSIPYEILFANKSDGSGVVNILDPFDPNHEAFISRCFISKNLTSGTDTTVSTRRKEYFNGTAECSSNCTYQGINEDFYIKCNCSMLLGEVTNTIGDDVLDVFPSMNIGVILCIWVVLTEVSLV